MAEMQQPLSTAPQQEGMAREIALGGQGSTMENMATLRLGKCYEVCCICCASCNCTPNLYTIPEGSVGVVTQFGKYDRTIKPGRHHWNIMCEEVTEVNLKLCCVDVPPQLVMTKDNLKVRIDAVCYYKVTDAHKAVFNVERYQFALLNLAQITMRTVLGEHTLAQLFRERNRINQRLRELIDVASDPWGIEVDRCELKEVKIDEQMQAAMAAKAEANQEAEAKVIQARAQRDAASILTEAASKMKGQPAAVQLQWFETLRIITTQGRNTTIIVPEGLDTTTAMATSAKALAGPSQGAKS